MMEWARKATALALALGAAVAGGTPAAWAKTEFRLSNQLPPSHHISKGLVVFAGKVKEYSKGAIEVKIFDSAQLFKDTEIVEGLQEGLIEAGLVPVNKWSGMIPAADVFEMPFIYKDLSSIKKFIDAGAGELLDREFQKRTVKTLFWVDYGYIQFFNNKHALTKPDDFKGLKMRTFSSGDADTLKALGAAPTVMSSSEMYMALQRGTVDGATTGMPAAVSRKVHEVQKFMTEANYTTAQFVVQASLKWWEKLPQDQREAILKAGKEAEEWIRGAIAQSEDEAEKVIRKAGVQIHQLTPEARPLFIKATEPVRQSFATKSGDLARKLIEMALSLK
ncbi:MAG TPA: DctP family TRAP transporter solute-binding subunit [Candidatus Methylomirabilis sp.]|nr:DctP family TRAP transporter solute-binding subunit [Candidatus Methylomirabilis sp.]